MAAYGDDARKRLDFIRPARDRGFPVENIRALLAVAAHPDQPCADAEIVTRAQLAAVERKIAQLESLRHELRTVATGCAGGPAAHCRIIEALTDSTLCEGHAGDDRVSLLRA